MLSNARMYYVATVRQRKKSSSPVASTSQNETSNISDEERDEESAAPIRVSPLSAHLAAQCIDVPACSTAETIFLQSLSKTCPAEPYPSLLLRRATAGSSHHIYPSQAAGSLHRSFDSFAGQRSHILPLLTRPTANSLAAAPASPHPSNLIPL
jgi:hypothetical protein